jgi:hypothetical protein
LAIAGVVVGFGFNQSMTKKKLGSAEAEAQKQLDKAKKEASKQLR